MGATSIPLVFSELYMALSQDTMDAQENSIYNLVSSNLGEVQKYVIFTYHAPMVSSYVMNKEQYDALTEEQQDLLHRMIDGIKADVIANIRNGDAVSQYRDGDGSSGGKRTRCGNRRSQGRSWQ